MAEEVIGALITLLFFGWFFKTEVESKCVYDMECAKNQVKWVNILVVVGILVGVLNGIRSYIYYSIWIGTWLGAYHGVDSVEKKAEERRVREAQKRRERLKNDECSQLPLLEAELKRVREEINKHYYASKATGFNPVADIAHQASAAKLLDRAEELEKKIQEIKRKHRC
ncbi:hypothetical protein [Thermococcus barossii]|uniref:Uncharacterized protein n=1 Tax=Thermococcus barossii TaxID=54077 RepID=A0A2Z2MHY7_9EURY|nr:hypothetical protein [Thermococcus barossii]ASJ05526.1 hypothetical protein A3L01_09185 [Thermococcus barossii]